MLEKVIRVFPRGFCAGVTRSIRAVEEALRLFGPPIYVKHAIVHNKTVIADLERKGAVFVEDLKEVPEGATVVFSAHGSPPEHFREAEKRRLRLIDATCPLVTKVHFEIIKAIKEGKQPLYIGHKDHVEAQGVLGEAKVFGVSVPVVKDKKDVELLDFKTKKPIVILAQTTFKAEKIKELAKLLQKKFVGQRVELIEDDICYATSNRQRAITELAKKVEVVFVVGSKESSNSNRLVEVAKEAGAEAFLLDGVEDLRAEWWRGKKTVGLSAGASAPEYKVQELADFFQKKGASLEELTFEERELVFKEPLELAKMKQRLSRLKIEFNGGEFDVKKDFVEKVLREAFLTLLEEKVLTKEDCWRLSVAAVTKTTIRKLNKKWRQTDKETDVLSFYYGQEGDCKEGEIVLAPEIIAENAREDGVTFDYELAKNLIHSFLHIIGYEHGREMFAWQDRILKKTINNNLIRKKNEKIS